MPAWTIIYVELFPSFARASLLVAWRWGRSTELIVALTYVLATDIQKCVQGLEAPMFAHLELGVAAIDFTVLTILTALAVREPRKWILCSAAVQMLVTSGHLAKALDADISRLSYAILMGRGGYPLLLLLMSGILIGMIRRHRAASSC